MSNTAFLYVLGIFIVVECIVIIILLARKQRNVEPRVNMENIERYIHESIHGALRKQNEELAKRYGEIFREAERIDSMLENDEIDIVSIAESASTRTFAMLIGRLEDEHISLTSDIRKVTQKISQVNAHLSGHRSANLSSLASDDQKNIRELEGQKDHLEERQAAVQKKLDELQKIAEKRNASIDADENGPKYRCSIATTHTSAIGD